MLVPVARAPGGTGAAPSPKSGTRGRDRIGVLICAGAAPRWGPWRWLLSCPQLGSRTSWDISRASWSRYAQGPEGQQRCRGRGALPAGPCSPRDASSIWDHSARWKPGCASRAAKGCSGASLCPHPQLLPPPRRLCYGLAPCSLAAQGSKFTPNSPTRTSKGKASSQVCSPNVLQSRGRCPQGTRCPTLCPQRIQAQPSTPQHPPGTPRAPPPRTQTSTPCQLPHLQQLQLQLQQLSGCETSELKPLRLGQACREAGPHKNPTASVPRCPRGRFGAALTMMPVRRQTPFPQ